MVSLELVPTGWYCEEVSGALLCFASFCLVTLLETLVMFLKMFVHVYARIHVCQLVGDEFAVWNLP